jgi:hypothetical protein
MDHEKWLEQYDRMIADHDRVMADDDRTLVEHKMTEENARGLGAMNQWLRRAIAAAVCEARNERLKRDELDDKITKLSCAQRITEENFSASSTPCAAAATVASRSRYSTAANSRHCRPCDSATPLCVTYPLYVFTPALKAG